MTDSHRPAPHHRQSLPRWLVRFYEMATESRRGRRNRFLRRLARHDR